MRITANWYVGNPNRAGPPFPVAVDRLNSSVDKEAYLNSHADALDFVQANVIATTIIKLRGTS